MSPLGVMDRPPSEGPCYGCRHDDHCHGTGDLEPTPGQWHGFVCTCCPSTGTKATTKKGAKKK